jgi:large subunit ribosomal protein L25
LLHVQFTGRGSCYFERLTMKISVTSRTLQGTGASRRLRNAGKTTGIVYGGNTAPVMIELEHNALFHALRKEEFHASVLELDIDGVVQSVLLRDYQMHPFKPSVLHIDFQRVDMTKEISKSVPLHFTGADVSPAVKLSASTISHVATKLTVVCLPTNLPQFITVDLSAIEAGKSLHAAEIPLPEGVRAVIKAKTNPVIVSASAPAIIEATK